MLPLFFLLTLWKNSQIVSVDWKISPPFLNRRTKTKNGVANFFHHCDFVRSFDFNRTTRSQRWLLWFKLHYESFKWFDVDDAFKCLIADPDKSINLQPQYTTRTSSKSDHERPCCSLYWKHVFIPSANHGKILHFYFIQNILR